jgi:hypothetical protein
MNPNAPQPNSSTEPEPIKPVADLKIPGVEPTVAPLDTGNVYPDTLPPKKKSKKKLILIVAGAVLVALVASGAVFGLWYNNPQNVVGDSFMKLATATSSEGTATLVMPSDGSTNTFALSYAQNEANEMSGTMTLASTGSGPVYGMKAAFAVDKEQTAYVKVENLRKTVETFAKSNPEGAMYITMFDGIIDSVDNKWISISQTDLQKLEGTESEDKELSCVEDKIAAFQGDKAQQNEVRDLYSKHPFIDVTQVGTETVEGVYSNHYQLQPNEAKAKEFFAGTKNLTVFKNIDGCVEQDLAKAVDDSLKQESPTADSKATDTVDYWVSVLSHEPVKLSVKSVESDKTTLLEFKPKLNTNPTVTIPKADKTLIELQAELMASYAEMFESEPLINDL